MSEDAFELIKLKLRDFAEQRDWNQFHSPKNLAMALNVEAAELLEHFQWLTEQQSASLDTDTLKEVADEIADIQVYLIRLADKLDVDIVSTTLAKIDKNAEKYPADKVRGQSKKYNKYAD
ncbi:MAG: nucleotide pyrophosphohydrolase [Gammaproteobacteria bacterium]|nr:nucleotide pyrophosphohydrolase [Gammaproteobacteria bacterium]